MTTTENPGGATAVDDVLSATTSGGACGNSTAVHGVLAA